MDAEIVMVFTHRWTPAVCVRRTRAWAYLQPVKPVWPVPSRVAAKYIRPPTPGDRFLHRLPRPAVPHA